MAQNPLAKMERFRETRRIYRFEYALALVLFLTLALPLPLMLMRGFTNSPILEWRQGIPAGGNVVPVEPIEASDWSRRWQRKAKVIVGKTEAFQDAFARSFGGRTALREGYGGLLATVFGASPAPEVIIGKSGWLFFAGELSMDGYRGLKAFTPKELELLHRTLVDNRAALEKQGTAYLVVLPPDKHTFYSEFMPDAYTRIGPPRIEQTVAYLRAHPGVDFLDLRIALNKAKAENPARPLYWKLDTHWNLIGAYTAYHAIVERLREKFPALHPLELSDLNRTESRKTGGDLAAMIQRDGETERQETLLPRLTPPNLPESAAWGYVVDHAREGFSVVTEYPTGEIGRAVIFHDSFMIAPSRYLTRHFRHARWFWGKYDAALVAQAKPDLVIEERIERRLHQWAGR